MSNINKYCLGICEIFNPALHGITSNSDPNICSHYIVHYSVELDEFWDLSYEDCLENLLEYYHNFNYIHRYESIVYHPIIRNYGHLLENIDDVNGIIKLDIIEIIELSGNEQVACIKTIWLKLLQRKWKRIYKERKDKIHKLKNLRILMKREITGSIK